MVIFFGNSFAKFLKEFSLIGVIEVIRRYFQKLWGMSLTFTLVIIMLLIVWLFDETIFKKFHWKLKSFIISFNAVLDFGFRLKSEDRMKAFLEIYRLYPKFVHFKLPFYRILMVYEPDIAKRIYNSYQCCQRPHRKFIQLESGLLASSYHDWREPRKLLNLAFNLNVLKGFIPIFSHHTDTTIKDMRKYLNKGESFNLAFEIAFLSARTVSATILNTQLNDFTDFEKVFDNINLVTDCVFKRIVNPFYHVNFIYKLTKIHKQEMLARDYLMEYASKLIEKVYEPFIDENANNVNEESKNDGKPKINFIVDQFLNHREKFSDTQFKEHLMTLLLTASDTTTNMTSASILYMAMKPDIQQKVYDEVCEVFNDNNDEIDYEKLGELSYLEKVLKETLRLFSPIPISMREAVTDFDIGIDSIDPIKKGTLIYILSYVLHTRRDIWGEKSYEFNPENFDGDKVCERNGYSFVPFGTGARNCLGSRYAMIAGKIMVAKLVKSYKFHTKLNEKDMKLKAGFVAKLGRDYSVTIEERN